ncbi:MAG TPA: PA2779 family protein [Thermodesulfovibrionales bacterium]|nr:PA2779 family protein [Thermodesulfovibrionales bacterium]
MRIPFARQVSWYLVVAMFLIGIAPRLDGTMIPSSIVAPSPSERAADLEQIRKVLEMKMVRERLAQFGYTSEEIKARVDSLSDHQIHEIAKEIDDLRVGKDAGGVIFAIIIIALVVIAILYFTKRRIVIQ